MTNIGAFCRLATLIALGSPLLEAQDWGPKASAVPFESLARDFLASHSVADLPEGEDAVQAVFDRSYLKVQLGLFVLHYPAKFLAEKSETTLLQSLSLAVLDAQQVYLDWSGDPTVTGRGSRRAKPEVAALRKWVQHWKLKSLGPGAAGKDALDALEADEEVRAAATALATQMIRGTALGMDRGEARAIPLILAPDRREFLGLAGFVGSTSEANRQALWQDGMKSNTSFDWRDAHVLALQYSDPEGSYDQGLDMNARERTGLLQHVVHHVGQYLTLTYFGGTIPSAYEIGLSVELGIAVLGENNARAGGSGESNVNEEHSQFLPGIDFPGVSLLPINADSKWRYDKGKYHFLRVLKRGQHEGARLASKQDPKNADPLACFALDTSMGTRQLVRAPFLDAKVERKGITKDAVPDYRELIRAYRTAFVYWLREKARPARGAKGGKQPFADLLRACAARPEGKSFEQLLEEIYGLPVSGPDRNSDSLEWHFLRWLAKQ